MSEKEKIHEEIKQFVVFKLGDEEFGVDIVQANEIEKLDQGITRVPKAPSFVEGVINLRGIIVPIVDLRKRFGLVVRELGADTRVIIVEVNGNKVGMIVDAVVEIARVNATEIEAAPAITKGIDTYFISGIAKHNERLIVLLNLERSLSPEEAKDIAKIKAEA